MTNRITDEYKELVEVINTILIPAYREVYKKDITISELIKMNDYNKLPFLLKGSKYE